MASRKSIKSNVVQTAGKRKRAVARATLVPGHGIIRLNSITLSAVQPEFARLRIQEPLAIAGQLAAEVDIDVNMIGGGWAGQVEAARLAIGKALVRYAGQKSKSAGEDLKKTFLEYDRHLLVADTRYKEPRKFGRHSRARAGRQTSYR